MNVINNGSAMKNSSQQTACRCGLGMQNFTKHQPFAHFEVLGCSSCTVKASLAILKTFSKPENTVHAASHTSLGAKRHVNVHKNYTYMKNDMWLQYQSIGYFHKLEWNCTNFHPATLCTHSVYSSLMHHTQDSTAVGPKLHRTLVSAWNVQQGSPHARAKAPDCAAWKQSLGMYCMLLLC